ncbi:MAG: UDP-glucose 4-epimerase GalE [Bacteroidota bacterium]
MNILVTGGTGYIGSHTTVELIKKGYRPILVDNLSNSHEGVVKQLEKITGKAIDFYNIDLCDRTALSKLLDTIKIDAVIHFAAFKSVGDSVKNPLSYYRNNLLSLLNLSDECIRRGISRLVFSSSCTVYGNPETLPVKESDPAASPNSPYGQTKLIGENILRDAAQAHGIRCISLRDFNPAGSHESGLIGENSLDTPNNLVPVITRTAAGKIDKLTVFGNDYATPDGTCIRDYIHVCDVAKAHVNALERLESSANNPAFEAFNLGTGKGSSVMEVIRAFEKISGMNLNYEIGPRRAGDVEKIWADPSLANQTLGWKPEYSLDDMVRSAWAYEQQLQTINAD